jgi:hypothetical protein
MNQSKVISNGVSTLQVGTIQLAGLSFLLKMFDNVDASETEIRIRRSVAIRGTIIKCSGQGKSQKFHTPLFYYLFGMHPHCFLKFQNITILS